MSRRGESAASALCPRCRQAQLVRIHAHDECPTCRYVEPCCSGAGCEAESPTDSVRAAEHA